MNISCFIRGQWLNPTKSLSNLPNPIAVLVFFLLGGPVELSVTWIGKKTRRYFSSEIYCVLNQRTPGNFFLQLATGPISFFSKIIPCSCGIYPSSHNHGSVKNGCISNRMVTFQIQPFSTEPWLLKVGCVTHELMLFLLHQKKLPEATFQMRETKPFITSFMMSYLFKNGILTKYLNFWKKSYIKLGRISSLKKNAPQTTRVFIDDTLIPQTHRNRSIQGLQTASSLWSWKWAAFHIFATRRYGRFQK